MRRAGMVCAVLAAVAVVAWVSLGDGGHARAAIRPLSPPGMLRPQPRTPPRAIQPEAGGACYVSIPRCSQTPCVEFIGGGSMPAALHSAVAAAGPTEMCRRSPGGATPGAVTVRGHASSIMPATVPALYPALRRTMAGLRHRLAARHR